MKDKGNIYLEEGSSTPHVVHKQTGRHHMLPGDHTPLQGCEGIRFERHKKENLICDLFTLLLH